MNLPNSCGSCHISKEDLKKCARCKSEFYCSRECQKAHWKVHKKVCGKSTSSSNSSTSADALDKPFHRLDAETWLQNRSEANTFQLLIDTYRFRAQDDYKLENKIDADNVLGGAKDSSKGFRRFLGLAAAKPHLLPAWWTSEKEQECVDFGMDAQKWQSLYKSISKEEIIEHYGDAYMPMQLRMFGEQVYGTGPGGQPGAMMRQMMMGKEAGNIPYSSLLSMH
ncbi:hypothetical protein TWF281_000013 [Arthrobotrys megalospora]